MVEQCRTDLIANGENPDDYFFKHEGSRWLMEWMINTQLGRRNLPPAQRLAVMDKFKRKIQEQAKSTQGTRTDLTSSPNGEKVISTHTDKELAKMAGVGTGTGTMKIRYLIT